MEEKERKIEFPDDDWVVFIPDEAMRAFNSAPCLQFQLDLLRGASRSERKFCQKRSRAKQKAKRGK